MGLRGPHAMPLIRMLRGPPAPKRHVTYQLSCWDAESRTRPEASMRCIARSSANTALTDAAACSGHDLALRAPTGNRAAHRPLAQAHAG